MSRGIAALLALAWIGHGPSASAGTRSRTASDERPPRRLSDHPPAYSPAAFAGLVGTGIRARWDRDTGVAAELWVPHRAALGAVADPAAASAAARAFLAEQLAVLAPGARLAALVEVSNREHGGLRTVAFQQRQDGLAVVGALVQITFAHDHLVLATSQAVPFVRAPSPAAPPGPAVQLGRAERAVATAIGATSAVTLTSALAGPRQILPLIRRADAAGPHLDYRVVDPIAVTATIDDRLAGHWLVDVDAATGEIVAQRSLVARATGTLRLDVGDRNPTVRRTAPASLLHVSVDGTPAVTAADGTVTWDGSAPASVAAVVTGDHIRVVNFDPASSAATATLSLPPDGSVTWSEATDEERDAQLDAYVYGNEVHDFVRDHIDDSLAILDRQIQVQLNDAAHPGAAGFATAVDIIVFGVSGDGLRNPARFADAVYHEYGHGVHKYALATGQPGFDGELSEGLADYTAAMITGDPNIAPGIGLDTGDEPLRRLAPTDFRHHYPEDAGGDEHVAGLIIGGSLWQLREYLVADLGEADGVAHANEIYYGVMRLAPDLAGSYAAALAADDDDGDLTNGTPNQCAIDRAFGQHGLATDDVAFALAAPPVVTQGADGTGLDVTVTTTDGGVCAAAAVTTMVAEWWPREAPDQISEVPLTAGAAAGATQHFTGTLPAQPRGTTIQYRIRTTYDDGSSAVLPDNVAEPQYDLYTGPVVPIFCEDFEDGASEVEHGGDGDDWEVGTPLGFADDPPAAFAGHGALGTDLTTDGRYPEGASSHASFPAIDVSGFAEVHLQFRRWLNVEDTLWDQAGILVNGAKVWRNPGYLGADANDFDREWRFVDFDITAQVRDGKVEPRFTLASDGSGDKGGWNIDDLCVVGVVPATCGDDQLDDGEACDDGNDASGDGCSATCQLEDDDGGCCSTGGDASAGGTLLLAGLTTVWVGRRRRALRS